MMSSSPALDLEFSLVSDSLSVDLRDTNFARSAAELMLGGCVNSGFCLLLFWFSGSSISSESEMSSSCNATRAGLDCCGLLEQKN